MMAVYGTRLALLGAAFLSLVAATDALAAAPATSTAADALAVPGHQLTDIFNNRDRAAFAERINMDLLGERVTTGMNLSERDKADFIKGMKQSRSRMADTAMTQIEAKRGKARLVKSTAVAKGSQQIIRIDYQNAEGDNEGYEYLEFELNERQQIRDWFVHSQGSLVSDFMRRLAVSMVQDESLITALFGSVRFDKDILKLVQQLALDMRAVDYPKAYATLQQFPADFKQTLNWATLQVSISSNLDEDKYRAALKQLADKHGNQPSLQFMLIDHYFYQQQYDRMVTVIQRFERRVVADGATHFLKCNGYFLAGQFADARNACARSVSLEPDVAGPWWLLIEVGLRTEDATLTLDTLTAYEEQFETQFDPDKLVALDGYRWLANRKEFLSWAEARR